MFGEGEKEMNFGKEAEGGVFRCGARRKHFTNLKTQRYFKKDVWGKN